MIFQTKGNAITNKNTKRKYKSFIKKRINPPEEGKKEHNINNIKESNYKTQRINKLLYSNKYFESEKEIYNNYSIISNKTKNKKMISTPLLYDTNEVNKNEEDTIDNENIILNYKINKIQQEIDNIKAKNESLLNNLLKEKEKNISLKSCEKDAKQILLEISQCIEVNNLEEIPNKLSEMINYLTENNNLKEAKAKNEFISNLKELYRKNNIEEPNQKINMKLIWGWIKYLINNKKKIKNEIDKNTILLQNIEKKNIFYKNNCEEIMNIYDVKNITQLDEFIKGLINKSNAYRKRIDQLKKILSEDNNKNK